MAPHCQVFSPDDERYMRLALAEAEAAADAGDVPIGAVIVKHAAIIARAHNQVELLKDPTAHAEIIAITQAAATVGDWRLTDTVLYVTKAPCPMCAGAITLARIPRVVYGAPDPQPMDVMAGVDVSGGLLADDCRTRLQSFFQQLRRAAMHTPGNPAMCD